MKERPILFSAPMVRAILEGRKTMTRRVIKNPDLIKEVCDGIPMFEDSFGNWHETATRCPYGQPGDRLWVRETFDYGLSTKSGIAYRATSKWEDFEDGTPKDFDEIKWKPSIHMPRWASRLTDEITAIRVERLQDISEEDALAEGVERFTSGWKNYTDPTVCCQTARASFFTLWESINGPGSWNANPLAWVIEFKMVKL